MPHSQQHPQPDEELLDDAQRLLDSVQQRVKRVTALSFWASRSTERAAELQTELAAVRAELALAQQELTFWRRREARTAGLDPDLMPPREYVTAVRTPQREPYRAVTVEIDGEPWTIGLRRDRPTDPDPLREMRDWQQLVTVVREIRQRRGES
ncbi:hypothetical protein [Thermoactinospora rubra]|uniref:hypothetical protein n=1 Tax=Thermoactinospora rubra TaxID=1088767 RepID=UPI000A122EB7|nr:hypothetical protein [Thermoactinospora rubra]